MQLSTRERLRQHEAIVPSYRELEQRGIIVHHADARPKGGPVLAFIHTEHKHEVAFPYAVTVMVMQRNRPLISFRARTNYQLDTNSSLNGHLALLSRWWDKEKPDETPYIVTDEHVLSVITSMFLLNEITRYIMEKELYIIETSEKKVTDDFYKVPVYQRFLPCYKCDFGFYPNHIEVHPVRIMHMSQILFGLGYKRNVTAGNRELHASVWHNMMSWIDLYWDARRKAPHLKESRL